MSVRAFQKSQLRNASRKRLKAMNRQTNLVRSPRNNGSARMNWTKSQLLSCPSFRCFCSFSAPPSPPVDSVPFNLLYASISFLAIRMTCSQPTYRNADANANLANANAIDFNLLCFPSRFVLGLPNLLKSKPSRPSVFWTAKPRREWMVLTNSNVVDPKTLSFFIASSLNTMPLWAEKHLFGQSDRFAHVPEE